MGFALLALYVGGFGLAGVAAWYFSHSQTILRRLRKAPTKRIAELRENELGKVVGRARSLGELIEAPLSGRRCLCFVAIVENHQLETTVIRETRGVPFILEDDSGRAVVDATAARIAVELYGRGTSGTGDDPTPHEEAFLARHGVSGRGTIFNASLRYREAVIEEGELITVLGAGTREPDPDAPPSQAYRGDAPTRLRLTSSAAHPLIISVDDVARR